MDSSWTSPGTSLRGDYDRILRFAEGQAVVQPQRYAESMRNTHRPRGEKSADSSWTTRGLPGDEYSRIERRFCALRKVRLWTNRSVMQSLYGIPTAHEGKNPRIPRGPLVEVPKDEYSRIERRFCALRKVRLRSNRSVMQSLCGVSAAHEKKNPKILRGRLRRRVFED